MGTPQFAVPSLDILFKNGYGIQTVVTAPDKPRGRGQELSATPVKIAAVGHQLSVLQPSSLADPVFTEQVKNLKPDIIVVVAFRILPPSIFKIPRLGTFNLHASLLPKYRGAAPINWAIINGEKETGVTSFLLEEKVDTGNILLQARVPITADDDAGNIHDKLAEVGAEIVLHTVRLLEQGKAVPKPQDNTLASLAPKIFKEDCRIDWDQPAASAYNRIRGLSPYPAAFTMHNGKTIKLYRSQVMISPPQNNPGKVIVSATTLHVVTGEGMLAIIELQQEGKKRMVVEEFLRGYKIVTGESFQ